jgi:hypothetical protein
MFHLSSSDIYQGMKQESIHSISLQYALLADFNGMLLQNCVGARRVVPLPWGVLFMKIINPLKFY